MPKQRTRQEQGQQGGVLKLAFLNANAPKMGESHFDQWLGYLKRQGIELPNLLKMEDVCPPCVSSPLVILAC